MLSVGIHPAIARPMYVPPNNATRLLSLLGRPQVGDATHRAQFDALHAAYLQQYRGRLGAPGTNELLRAPALDDFAYASAGVTQSANVQALLPTDGFAFTQDSACFSRTGPQSVDNSIVSTTPFSNSVGTGNLTANSLKMAAHLLTHPTLPAKHCMVFDTGLREADGGGGYDTHNETPFTQSHNLYNFFSNLLPLVKMPGENSQSKIDLDKTLIILNMEFGRAPGLQKSTNTGRDHWQHGYVQVYIGGPVQKGVYGVIPEDGYATSFTTPLENRIAGLLALGIWPFDAASYSSGQVQDADSESSAVRSVMQRVLGYSV